MKEYIQNTIIKIIKPQALLWKIIDNGEFFESDCNFHSSYAILATEEEIISYDLKKAKKEKLAELENYHKTSPELRLLTINDKFTISLTGEGRSLVNEQLDNLARKIELKQATKDNAYFDYYQDKIANKITYTQLLQLSVAMQDIVNKNYVVYDNHKKTINEATDILLVKNYAISENFLKNNKISF